MIDEKRLIEALASQIFSAEVYNDDFDGVVIRNLLCLGDVTAEVMKQLDEQPKVEEWIPCSERLPKHEDAEHGWVKCNVTVMRSHYPTSSYDYCDSPYDEYFVEGAMYDVSQKIWHIGEYAQLNALIDIEDSPLNGDCVIAWMPLPPEYKGE